MTKLFKLPLLEKHDEALEKCVYCPKLCRAACSVAVVSASETLTPWGKMSLAYFQARGDLELDQELAATAWACSSCMACEQRCEHDHRVAEVLGDARAALAAEGKAPQVVQQLVAATAKRNEENREAVQRLVAAGRDGGRTGGTPLLVGCGYARGTPKVAEDICQVSEQLLGSLELHGGCCGLPLLDAGEHEQFKQHIEKFVSELAGKKKVVVADPGCARALVEFAPRLLPELVLPEVILLVDLVYANMDRIPADALKGRTFGYQDPCQLGRGLGRYEEPRAILARLSGEPPVEMLRNRQHAECSGGGGLLPLSYPDASEKMADERIAEQGQRGGELVTACAQSLKRYRSRGAEAHDLMSLVAEAWRQCEDV